MKRKYVKLNDNYSHLSLGNIMSVIKEESKNKSSAIQSEVFCTLFNVSYINESTVNNYSIGSRSIGNEYKQIYINLKNKYLKDEKVFIDIVTNIISIINGSLYDIKDINKINTVDSFQRITTKLYNIGKNDFYIPKNYISNFRNLLKQKKYYNLFVEMVCYAILEKKQPLYEDEKYQNVIETILENTDISVIDLQNFLILELNEGINFSHSLKLLAKHNNPYANYHLAVMEYRGEFSGEPRYDKAFNYFKEASLNNHPSSYWMLGNMIIQGKLGIPSKKDYEDAFNYFKASEHLGNKAAINSIGICYERGYGVKKNMNKALEYFKKAANKNYAYAFNNLGYYYESIKDYEQAFSYYLKSANLYESYGANKVGEYYRTHNDYINAYKYYNIAIESSIRETTPWAYYNLAKYFYLNGCPSLNIVKDIDKAILYFNNSKSLINSLEELLYIYFNNHNLDKVLEYKKLIELHPLYNNEIKNRIENKLKDAKKEIIIP